MTRGTDRIAAERERQLAEEGWSEEHDAKHRWGVLSAAAACYALPGYIREERILGRTLRQILWPWDEGWWKPDRVVEGSRIADGRVRELEKAGALIAAEIDKILTENDQMAERMREIGRHP